MAYNECFQDYTVVLQVCEGSPINYFIIFWG